jgi:hypothetical protein
VAFTLLSVACFPAHAGYPIHRPARDIPAAPEGDYAIHPDQPKQVIKVAGIEGVSFEYKTLQGWDGPGTENKLRCFGKDFKTHPVYHVDVQKFLADFGVAIQKDLQLLKDANIPIFFCGLQNEPFANTRYSSCTYNAEERLPELSP